MKPQNTFTGITIVTYINEHQEKAATGYRSRLQRPRVNTAQWNISIVIINTSGWRSGKNKSDWSPVL